MKRYAREFYSWLRVEWFAFWHGIRWHYPVQTWRFETGRRAASCACGDALEPR